MKHCFVQRRPESKYWEVECCFFDRQLQFFTEVLRVLRIFILFLFQQKWGFLAPSCVF